MLKKALFILTVSALLLTVFYEGDSTKHFPKGATKANLQIFRDQKGIAHLVSNNTEDLMYGLGFVQAQDRLWTLHMKKRLIEGRISELLGP